MDSEARRELEATLAAPPELGIAIPIVVAAGIFGGHVGVLAALAALVVIYLVSALRR